MAEKDLISNRRRSSFPSPVVVDTFYQESIDRKSGLVGVLVWLLVHIRVVLLLVTFFWYCSGSRYRLVPHGGR